MNNFYKDLENKVTEFQSSLRGHLVQFSHFTGEETNSFSFKLPITAYCGLDIFPSYKKSNEKKIWGNLYTSYYSCNSVTGPCVQFILGETSYAFAQFITTSNFPDCL